MALGLLPGGASAGSHAFLPHGDDHTNKRQIAHTPAPQVIHVFDFCILFSVQFHNDYNNVLFPRYRLSSDPRMCSHEAHWVSVQSISI